MSVLLAAVFWRAIATTALIGGAQMMIAAGWYSTARTLADAAIAVHPDEATAHFELGRAIMMDDGGRIAEAVEPLRKALKGNPQSVKRLGRLGTALFLVGQVEESLAYLEQARDLVPQSPGIRKTLGKAYLRLHRPASARREFQEALQLKSDAEILLGLAAAWAGNDEPKLARGYLEAAIATDSRMASLTSEYPMLHRLRGEPEIVGLLDSPRAPAQGWSPD